MSFRNNVSGLQMPQVFIRNVSVDAKPFPTNAQSRPWFAVIHRYQDLKLSIGIVDNPINDFDTSSLNIEDLERSKHAVFSGEVLGFTRYEQRKDLVGITMLATDKWVKYFTARDCARSVKSVSPGVYGCLPGYKQRNKLFEHSMELFFETSVFAPEVIDSWFSKFYGTKPLPKSFFNYKKLSSEGRVPFIEEASFNAKGLKDSHLGKLDSILFVFDFDFGNVSSMYCIYSDGDSPWAVLNWKTVFLNVFLNTNDSNEPYNMIDLGFTDERRNLFTGIYILRFCIKLSFCFTIPNTSIIL